MHARTMNRPGLMLPLSAAALLLSSSAVLAAPVTIDLCAKQGSVTMPDGVAIPIWGFAPKPASTPCSDSSVSPTLPGPVLEVAVGDTVTVTLDNQLGDSVSIVFPALGGVPDTAGAAPGGSTSYNFTPTAPGTYLYESGVNAQVQVPMGLYGALIVHPATPGRAYNGAATAYDRQEVLLLSEIDPLLNSAADPNAFDLLDFSPKYWLINGKAYPDTAPLAAAGGETLLLRYLNAGSIHHTMTLLGAHQRLIATDAFELPYPYDLVAHTIPAGQTADTLVVFGSSTAAQQLALYNRQLLPLTNAALPGGNPGTVAPHFPGGMQTFVEVAAGTSVTPLYFSTIDSGSSGAVPGVSGPWDDADIYTWDGVAFTRVFDASANGLPGGADIDGLTIVDSDTFYVSFSRNTPFNLSGYGAVYDEDVLLYDAGTWTLYFDGSSHGLGASNERDIDALDVQGGTFYFSTEGSGSSASIAGVSGPYDDADIYSWNGSSFARVWDASANGLPSNADIDGLRYIDSDTFYLSFRAANTTVPGLGAVQDEDVVRYDAGTWTLYFDGTANGLGVSSGQDLDAIYLQQ